MSRDLTQSIVHVDCDAFYAAVEQLERPELKTVPFAVGGGVLTTCNYVARQFGCRSGMAGFVAKKLCPNLVMLKPNFEKYNAKAHEVRDVLVNYDPRFESASIDEAYLNITEYCKDHDMDPFAAVDQMRQEISDKTQITVSAGIAANAKLAKICSNMNKPNGQYLLPSDRNSILEFMRILPTRKVNGIGRVLERELLEIGIQHCGDLYPQRQYLYRLFGEKTSVFLFQCYLGLGRTQIQPAEEYERKSVGTESTFKDMSDPLKLREKLRWTAEELEKDLKRAECKGRTLCLKVKLHTFEVYTRQVVTPRAICVADDLYTYGVPMLTKLEQEFPGMKLRLMGLRCTHLVSTKRPDADAFFGIRPKKAGGASSASAPATKRKAGDDYDEYDEEYDQATGDMTGLSESTDPKSPGGGEYRRHGKEIAPNPKVEAAQGVEEEWWDCPICQRPQKPDERLFNEHIDLCLSRQTIREAAQGDDAEGSQSGSREPKRPRVLEKKKATGRANDPKQRKLNFG